MLISLTQLLAHAKKHQYAVAAFNVNFLEQANAILDAAKETQSPVILQVSTGGLKHMGRFFLEGLRQEAIKSELPIVLHRDHCHSIQEFEQALALGFSSIMMDGTLDPEGMPRDFDENVAITLEAMKLKPKSVSLEAELGCLGALETGLSGEEDGTKSAVLLQREQLLTDPTQAAEFIQKTQADALAIAIGTSHGAYKFKTPPSDNTLDIERVKHIAKALPNTPLVLHGSSSISQETCLRINQAGGDIPKTYGVPIEAIQKAIAHGVCKVNIDTDLRLATTEAFRQALQDKTLFDPRGFLKPAYQNMKQLCIHRYQAFKSENQATEVIRYVKSTSA